MRNKSSKSSGLHRFAFITACATFLLIVAGGLVTSNEAGLAVPDWPLSYGSWMPPMEGNIRYEHTHRMIAAGVGILTLILAIWLWRREVRRWVRWVGIATLLAVMVQGILGGITVLYLLPLPISMSHASLAQIVFCLVVSLAVFTSEDWKDPISRTSDAGTPRLRHLCMGTTVAIFLQLVLGAALRHTGKNIMPHVVGSVIVSALVVWTSLRVFYGHTRQWNLVRVALLLMGFLFIQLLLGTGSYLIRLATQDAPQPMSSMVALTTAHVAAGALMLAISLILTLEVYRTLKGLNTFGFTSTALSNKTF